MSSERIRAPRFTLGISLKMYFGNAMTLRWCAEVGRLAAEHPAVTSGCTELIVLPTFPALVPARETLHGTGVQLGAQDLCTEDSGAFTGEVSGAELAEIGCTFAEVGHAERRRRFGETDAVVGAKVLAALRNGLTPLVCVGELERGSAARAADQCVAELERILGVSRTAGARGRVVVAYEPHWAIGAPEPAPIEHIDLVCARLSAHLDENDLDGRSRTIYGGSAGPGLLTALDGGVRGLFLGRMAHEPAALAEILDETSRLGRLATRAG